MRQRSGIHRWCAGVGVVAVLTLAAAGCGGGGGSSGAVGASGSRSALLRPASPTGTASAQTPPQSAIALPTADFTRTTQPTSADPTTEPPTTEPPTTEPPTTEPPTTQPPTRPPITIVPVVPPTSAAVTTAAPTISPSPVSSNSGTSKAWIWVLVAVAVIAAVALAILLVQRHRRARERWVAWRRTTRPLLDSALLARTLLPEAARDIDSPAHWRDVQERVEHAARGLESATMTAPDASASGAARDAAAGLRNSVFAVEAARLLLAADRPPTAAELAEADEVTRARRAELEAALGRLDQIVSPPDANATS